MSLNYSSSNFLKCFKYQMYQIALDVKIKSEAWGQTVTNWEVLFKWHEVRVLTKDFIYEAPKEYTFTEYFEQVS